MILKEEPGDNEDIYDMMPVFALFHHIYKNMFNYSMKNPRNIPLFYENKYLIHIYLRKNLSQDDLADIFGQSKGTIAKHLKTLEDGGYITRQIDENNRRKYILKTTKKGDKIAILKIEELKEWNDKVGISDLDDKCIEKLKNIARKSDEFLKNI